jgi:phosphoribosyl-dephospho-CoA transferase
VEPLFSRIATELAINGSNRYDSTTPGHLQFHRATRLIPHDLLRLNDPRDLVYRVPPPSWSHEALSRAPWVVVRRAPFENELIPVGVRGKNRSERFAAFAHAAAIVQCVSPEDLAACQAWREASRREEIPALRALPKIHLALQALGLSWGPVGSVGFELATAFPAANCSSDLDLIIRLSDALVPRLAEKVVEAIEDAGTRVDVLLETAAGAIALAEYVRSGPNLLLRTVNGPRLVASG